MIQEKELELVVYARRWIHIDQKALAKAALGLSRAICMLIQEIWCSPYRLFSLSPYPEYPLSLLSGLYK